MTQTFNRRKLSSYWSIYIYINMNMYILYIYSDSIHKFAYCTMNGTPYENSASSFNWESKKCSNNFRQSDHGPNLHLSNVNDSHVGFHRKIAEMFVPVLFVQSFFQFDLFKDSSFFWLNHTWVGICEKTIEVKSIGNRHQNRFTVILIKIRVWTNHEQSVPIITILIIIFFLIIIIIIIIISTWSKSLSS